ncbi:MAG TPA: aldo/keto reductase [Vicinamibacterales bacterium]|jgi:hypothetical protein
MQYRPLPKFPELRLSVLGFGCMRLPTVGRGHGHIDEELAAALVRRAVDGGVNYLDTAQPYHNGESERFVGRLLRQGLRGKVHVATKLPTWLVQAEVDWERLLDEQLTKLDCSTIDFYMFHGLSAERWDLVQRLHGIPALERARADGRIRHLGFSFHGSPDAFRTIIDGYDWDFCQIQYNFMDEEFQAGTAGLGHAASKQVAVFAMEPLRGGSLSAEPPEPVKAIWQQAAVPRTPADWALRWVWNHSGVTMALSGMNASSQVEENLASADAAGANALSPEDLRLVAAVRDFYRERMRVSCTTCGYCMPCPNGVQIPDVFSAYNMSTMFDARKTAAMVYQMWVVKEGSGADRCLRCGECEPKCPQHIPIPDTLEEAHAHLTSAAGHRPQDTV